MSDPWHTVLPDQPFPYDRADYEEVACNLCGTTSANPVASTDRNGLCVKSVICRRCGLIYLSPRMTATWYQRYYEIEYRRQMLGWKRKNGAAVHGKTNLNNIFASQCRRAKDLIEFLRKHNIPLPNSALEIGCSTGGLLRTLADAGTSRVLGVEPSTEEVNYARSRGVTVHRGLFEDFAPETPDRFDLVVCTQAFNHLLNPRAVAERVREVLNPGGIFYLECQNFFNVCQIRDRVSSAVQIDHVYMFVPATIQAIVEVAGFEVLSGSLVFTPWRDTPRQQPTSLHMQLLARPRDGARQPSSSYAEIAQDLALFPNPSALGALLLKVRNRLRRYARAALPWNTDARPTVPVKENVG